MLNPVVLLGLASLRYFTDKIVNYPISGRAAEAPSTETVSTGSIPGRVEPKTRKIGTQSCSA